MSLSARVEELGARLGLGPLALTEGAALELQLADGEAVSLELAPGGGVLHLHTRLGLLPAGPEPRRVYLEALLAASHADASVDGSAAALDPRTETAVLWRSLSEPEVSDADALRSFLERLRAVRERLASLDDEARRARPAQSPQGGTTRSGSTHSSSAARQRETRWS